MDKDVVLIMINKQEEEQLRSQDVPNIILILGIKGKANGLPRCTSFNAQVQ